MKTPRISERTQIGLLSVLCAAGLALATPVAADSGDAYVNDSTVTVVRSGFGECVRTSSWSKDITHPECNPAQVAAVEPAVQEPRRSVQRINLSSDAYFGFDKAELKPEGQAKLDEVAAEMQGTQDPRIQITGYTDRIGTEDYNLDLSQRRAEAVRDYLVGKGIETEIIETAAMGEKDPVVSCEGKTGNELIQCLSPNRRTVVEFSAFEVVEETK
jgi:OOP family OmpA-OmpF porin